MAANTAARRKIPRGVDAALVVVGGGGGGRRGGSDEAPRRIPDGGPPDVAHRSARGKKVEGFIRRSMETTAATATARGGDDGGDDNDDNFAIAMVINLDLRTAGVRRYVARLNLTGGMAVSLFFQGGDGGGGGGGARGEEKTITTTRTTRRLPHRWGRRGNSSTCSARTGSACRGNYWR